MEHPGFKNVQNQIASKEGVSKNAAGAILAKHTRMASAEAREKNPRLNKVKGGKSDDRAKAIQRRMQNNKEK